MEKLINLKSGQDFKSPFDLKDLKINDIVLTKQSVATGWAEVVKVVRITKTQIEVETINLIPTIDHFKWGIKNPFKNRGKGFFQFWSERKKILKGNRPMEKEGIESLQLASGNKNMDIRIEEVVKEALNSL